MKKICFSTDIDGVLNYYPESFFRFCVKKFNISLEEMSQLRSKNYELYSQYKNAYRHDDYKYTQKGRDKLIHQLNKIKDSGNELIVCSSRPFDRYPGMHKRTLEWLDLIGLKHNGLYKKSTKVFQQHCVTHHIDDEEDQIKKLANCKVAFYLLAAMPTEKNPLYQVITEDQFPDLAKKIYDQV